LLIPLNGRPCSDVPTGRAVRHCAAIFTLKLPRPDLPKKLIVAVRCEPLRSLAEALQNQQIARETIRRSTRFWSDEMRHPAGTRLLSQSAQMLYISAVIVAEIRIDVERVAEPERRSESDDRRMLSARPMLHRRVLPVGEDVMLRWRLPIERGRKVGHASQPDPIIGATALEHGLTVVSRDTGDYEKANVPAVDPWLAAAGL
jgi:toxin FitB